MASNTTRMIVVDTSIWIDHLQKPEPHLGELLLNEQAVMHPNVLGEIAVGSIRDRETVLGRLDGLRVPTVLRHGHLLSIIEKEQLWNTGIGYSDAHILASTLYTPEARLWTRDRRLGVQAERRGVRYDKPKSAIASVSQ